MAAQMLKLEPQSAILEEALGARLIDGKREPLSLIHISEPTRLRRISYAVFCFDETTPRGAKVRVRLVAGRASQKHTKIRRRRWGTKRNGAPLTTGH